MNSLVEDAFASMPPPCDMEARMSGEIKHISAYKCQPILGDYPQRYIHQ